MNSLYYTLKDRKSIKTLRIEYGQLGLKFVLRMFEGQIDRMGERENLPKEILFEGEQELFNKIHEIKKRWMEMLGVEDTLSFSSHSMRKTKATVIYNKTKNIDAVRRLLGQSSVTATSAYIGVTDNSALELARNINV